MRCYFYSTHFFSFGYIPVLCDGVDVQNSRPLFYIRHWWLKYLSTCFGGCPAHHHAIRQIHSKKKDVGSLKSIVRVMFLSHIPIIFQFVIRIKYNAEVTGRRECSSTSRREYESSGKWKNNVNCKQQQQQQRLIYNYITPSTNWLRANETKNSRILFNMTPGSPYAADKNKPWITYARRIKRKQSRALEHFHGRRRHDPSRRRKSSRPHIGLLVPRSFASFLFPSALGH